MRDYLAKDGTYILDWDTFTWVVDGNAVGRAAALLKLVDPPRYQAPASSVRHRNCGGRCHRSGVSLSPGCHWCEGLLRIRLDETDDEVPHGGSASAACAGEGGPGEAGGFPYRVRGAFYLLRIVKTPVHSASGGWRRSSAQRARKMVARASPGWAVRTSRQALSAVGKSPAR